MSRPGIEPGLPWEGGEHSRREPFEQLILMLFGTTTELELLPFGYRQICKTGITHKSANSQMFYFADVSPVFAHPRAACLARR